MMMTMMTALSRKHCCFSWTATAWEAKGAAETKETKRTKETREARVVKRTLQAKEAWEANQT